MSKLEILIVGCEVALNIFISLEYTAEWAEIQNVLGNAYSDRIRGEKSR